jgi:hypothetical protein
MNEVYKKLSTTMHINDDILSIHGSIKGSVIQEEQILEEK